MTEFASSIRRSSNPIDPKCNADLSKCAQCMPAKIETEVAVKHCNVVLELIYAMLNIPNPQRRAASSGDVKSVGAKLELSMWTSYMARSISAFTNQVCDVGNLMINSYVISESNASTFSGRLLKKVVQANKHLYGGRLKQRRPCTLRRKNIGLEKPTAFACSGTDHKGAYLLAGCIRQRSIHHSSVFC